jgi:hypothetical protein
MLQQLSGKMKNLVKRTKLLANNPQQSDDSNLSTTPQARSRTISSTNLIDTTKSTSLDQVRIFCVCCDLRW